MRWWRRCEWRRVVSPSDAEVRRCCGPQAPAPASSDAEVRRYCGPQAPAPAFPVTRTRRCAFLALALVAGLAGRAARAAPPDRQSRAEQAAPHDRLADLEQRLAEQQGRIDQLQQQLVSQQRSDEDAARVEGMRRQIREILSEQEFREQLMPTTMLAGYDKGFYIRSSDERFALRINGRMQFRWTHYATRSENRYLAPGLRRDDRTGFDVQRLRLTFGGHAWSEDLTWRIELDAGRSSSYDARVQYAWLNYKVSEELQFMAGIFKLASTRAQVTSSASLQFVDRSVTDAVFELGRGLGVRVWGRLLEKRLEYMLDIVNSLNGANNRTITPDPAEHDNNPALLARLVWHALGDDPVKDFAEQADLDLRETPALDFGFSYAFNDDQGDAGTTRIPFPSTRRTGVRGGFGLTSTNGLQINQFGFDSAFKHLGFSATGEYFVRIVDPRRAGRTPFTPWWVLTGQDDTTVMQGAYVQVGYFLPIPGLEKKLEAVARVGGISTVARGQEGTWEYAGGLNYYIEGQKIKLQTDVTKVSEVPISSSSHSLANVNDDALIWRVQLQVAF